MGFRLRRPGRRKANPDGSMTLMEHLFELRNRLFVAMVALVVGAVIGYIWWGVSPFGLSSLGDLVTGPYCGLPQTQRFAPNPGQCQLLQTGPFEAFNTRLKVGLAAGAVLTGPVWLYQIWAFITPGLYTKERRFAMSFVGIASVLFAVGAMLAYYIVPAALRFLAGVGDGQFVTALTADRYIGLLLTMLLVFGVSFELPLLVVMLNRIGVLPYAKLRVWQRGIVFGLFVLAAVATPGQDPVSMIALSAALVVLFELSVLVAWSHDRRLARRRAEQGWEDLGPDEAAPLNHRVEPVADPPQYDEAT
ncbi:MAG: twin-arginine translocase subunit TatC [Actinomycetota bacterium]|nr:twin-arginine translocase subunit TatC [Actinomycetota bacterium]